MKTIRFSFFIASALMASFSALGQDYVVTHKGDTLKGQVKIYNFGTEKKLQVNSPDKKKVILPIFQIRSFVFENETYHPVKGPAGYAFMKLVQDGYLSVYAFQQPNQVSYDGLLLARKDGTTLEVPNLNFKKALKRFLDDCPDVTKKIEEGTYSRNDLTTIVTDYNQCIQKNSERPLAKPAVAVTTTPAPKPESWNALEEKVKALGDFNGKSDALEMISEIQKKITANEKVPNFMVEGLKNYLKDKGVDNELTAALAEIK